MTWSANEVQALAAKAARGGGAPAGQAASFGRAAVIHLCADRPADDLISALGALPEGPIMSLPLALAQVLETTQCRGPVRCASAALAQSYCETLPFAHEISLTPDGMDLCIDLTRPGPRRPVKRVALPADLIALLDDLASRILVPESDASRRGGAGAGLTDND